MLFDKLWAQVKGAERAGKLTVEEALDCATRLPQGPEVAPVWWRV
jgi:hypothetical protein